MPANAPAGKYKVDIMKRRQALLMGGSITLGIVAAALADYLGAVVIHTDDWTRYMLDLLAIILVTGVPLSFILEPALPGAPKKEEGEWLVIRLTVEGYDALHAIMATECDLTEKEAIDRLLVAQRQALRQELPGR